MVRFRDTRVVNIDIDNYDDRTNVTSMATVNYITQTIIKDSGGHPNSFNDTRYIYNHGTSSAIKVKRKTYSSNYYYSNNSNSNSDTGSIKRFTRYYKQKLAVYNFLQRPRGPFTLAYHLIVYCIVLVCLVLTVFDTSNILVEKYHPSIAILQQCSKALILLFVVEFLLRCWSSSCLLRYRGWGGFVNFILHPFGVIDILIIITYFIALLIDHKIYKAVSLSLRCVRFLQLFKITLDLRFRPLKMLASVIWSQREHLIISIYLGFLTLLVVSSLVYLAEKDANPQFKNIGESMWWGVVTFGTVGYGDIHPITPLGKILACSFFIIGVSLFSLPAGILGSGLALKVEEHKIDREMTKRQVPAVRLIQNMWRFKKLAKADDITINNYLLPNTNYTSLSNRQVNAIKFFLMVKYYVAKRNFFGSSHNYDTNSEVFEHYSSGRLGLLPHNRTSDPTKREITHIRDQVDVISREVRECRDILATFVEIFRENFDAIQKGNDEKRSRDVSKLRLRVLSYEAKRKSF